MTDHFAYTFRCDLTLAQIEARLNAVGPWQWEEAHKDSLGCFLSATPLPDARRSYVRIFLEPEVVDGSLYVVNVLYVSDDAEAQIQASTQRRTLFAGVLPAIGARELTETEGFE